MMAADTKFGPHGLTGSIPMSSEEDMAALAKSYAHVAKLRDEVIAAGVLPPISEWKNYKWGTVTPVTQAASLVNKEGYLYSGMDSCYTHARMDEIEKEIRAQVERAKAFGIDPTHFDAHMGCLFIAPAYLQLLIKMGREYKVPVLLNAEGGVRLAATQK